MCFFFLKSFPRGMHYFIINISLKQGNKVQKQEEFCIKMNCMGSSVRDPLHDASLVAFLVLCQVLLPVQGCRGRAMVSSRTKQFLTSCLWVLSCWWMPFAEPELPMACKSHGQMLSEVHQTTVPRSSTRWCCLLD